MAAANRGRSPTTCSAIQNTVSAMCNMDSAMACLSKERIIFSYIANGKIFSEIFNSDQIDGGGELKEEVVKEAGVDYSDYGVTDEEMQKSYGK